MITLMKTKLPSGVTEHFIKQKIGKDKSSAAFCQDILEMADDMKNLLDPLLIVFGGAAKLAPLLFYARMNPNIASKAEQLQKSMLTWWLDRRIPVDKVFEWLGLSTGFTYENLDVLAQYILQCNSEGHANIDVFTYLRGKFGDSELAMITLVKTKLPSGVTEHFIKQKIGKDKSSAAFCQDILEMADDMKNLLDPLLIVFGGAAKLAPLLFYARMNPNIASKAEQLQKSMLTWWLDRRIPVDKVFEWLGLSNLRSTGFTYENLVALDQYFVAYYVEYPLGKMDLLTYLRNNVGDGQLTLMVLKWEGVSEFAKNVGSDLVVRWRNETPKILPTDFLTKDMGEHEILAVEQYYRSAMAHNLLH
uniref:RxLR effector candidate protein n=1 Tax=Hyaloperonospora arabidopsidis (strain Emoy2) TaxID=559515 RepID=M4BR31_HYAAE